MRFHWVPVTANTNSRPDNCLEVLLALADGRRMIGFYDSNKNYWCDQSADPIEYEVTHYAEMPDHPTNQEKHMGIFSRKPPKEPPACAECGVLYVERPGDRYYNFCARCAEPRRDRQIRIDMVLRWAEANFEELEPTTAEWRKKSAIDESFIDKRGFKQQVTTITMRDRAQVMPTRAQANPGSFGSPCSSFNPYGEQWPKGPLW